MPPQSWSRQQLAEIWGATLEGPDGPMLGPRDPKDAAPEHAVLARDAKYVSRCLASRAGLIILPNQLRTHIATQDAEHQPSRALLFVENIELVWEQLLSMFKPSFEHAGISPKASIHPTAVLSDDIVVQANATVLSGAVVGTGTVIEAGAFIGERARIGKGCLIRSHAVLLHEVELGDHVIIHPGAVIGSDGFGYRKSEEGRYVKLEHIGKTVLEDDVEIGANTVIDRATVGETRIKRGTKIGPACVVAHNCTIGEDVLLVGAVQLAGSVNVGNRAVLMGQVGAAGHLTIGEGAIVTGQSGISKDLPAWGMYRGSPARAFREQLRLEAQIHQIELLTQRVRALEHTLVNQTAPHTNNEDLEPSDREVSS